MKTIQTENGLQTIIMQEGDYTLLATYYKGSGEFREYVVAWLYHPKGCWGQGHYFWHDLAGAIDYFKSQTDRNYIPRRRLEELATISIHALVDKEIYEDYKDDLYLEPNEIEYFGLEIEEDEDCDVYDGELLMDDDELFDLLMGV